ncbi:unnamed protein product [Blepharisma stoltei]|uniref:Uncharacterized protein n=1 Tax=Blepharisma stoltei TaxID=1481888 RepID=A0AAU9IC76_9CILI|nr:unnamed protein product [Blepharisma stoltei]
MGCSSSSAENPRKSERTIDALTSKPPNNFKSNLDRAPAGSHSFVIPQNNVKVNCAPSFTTKADKVNRKTLLSLKSESESDSPEKSSKAHGLDHFRKKTQDVKTYLKRLLKKAEGLDDLIENLSKSPRNLLNSSVFEAPLVENSHEEGKDKKSNDLFLVLEELVEIDSSINMLNKRFTMISGKVNKLLMSNNKTADKDETAEKAKKIENERKMTNENLDDIKKENVKNFDRLEFAEQENLKGLNEDSMLCDMSISNILASGLDATMHEIEEKEAENDIKFSNANSELDESMSQTGEDRSVHNISFNSAPDMISKSRVIATQRFKVTTKQPEKSKFPTKTNLAIDPLAGYKVQSQPISTPNNLKLPSEVGKVAPFYSPANGKSGEQPRFFQSNQGGKSSGRNSQIKSRASEEQSNLGALNNLKKKLEAEIDSKSKSRIQRASFNNIANHLRSFSNNDHLN